MNYAPLAAIAGGVHEETAGNGLESPDRVPT